MMSLRLKAFPHGRPSAPRRVLRPSAAAGLVLVLAASLAPGLARPAPASASASTSAVAKVPTTARTALGAASSTEACARKKRKAARKACRAAVRARAAQAQRVRTLAVSTARVARNQWVMAARTASLARASAATTSHKECKARKRAEVRQKCHRTVRKHNRAARGANAAAGRAARRAEATRQAAVALVGRPPLQRSLALGSYFSYPNQSGRRQRAIRSRVLGAIRSTWGGPRDGQVAWAGNGSIRIVTWSFNDWQVAKALRAAHRRGVSVQIIAARRPNRDHRPWHWLRDQLGTERIHPSVTASSERVSFVRHCRGSCRGPGGTPHSKYMLFDRVGPAQSRHLVVQTSMNLTRMAYQGQWNQAQVMSSPAVYADFLRVFRESRQGRRIAVPYHTAALGNVVNYFFPRPQARAEDDPVMQVLSGVKCKGATAGGTRKGRTKIRIVQYAMYGERGQWIAKRLRKLWSAGCDIKIIYSISSRPIRLLLRNGHGRGPIPMRQSILVDRWGWVTGYNHAKWMTITGTWGSSRADHLTLSGSANWSTAAFSNDEQMQLIRSAATARRHLESFEQTWRQRSTRPPGREIVSWNIRIA